LNSSGKYEQGMNDMTNVFVKDDKEEYIGELLEVYGKKVTNLPFSYVKDWKLAEDLTQDVFIKVYEKLDTFQNRAGIQTWIYKIAANHCKDHLRKKYYQNKFLVNLVVRYYKSNESSPEHFLDERLQQKSIAEKVLSLPIKYREIIILYYYEDLSIIEISELLNMNSSTIKSPLLRARKQLKKLLREDSNE
jgi:RNA polymerase sigma-70 factor (ECF subfamily)